MVSQLTLAVAAGFLVGAMNVACAAPDVSVRQGDVWLENHQVTGLGNVTEAGLAPNGHAIAFIRRDKKGETDIDGDYTSLWLTDAAAENSPRKLVSWRAPAAKPEDQLMGFRSLHWSLDDKSIYFLSSAWATSFAVHRVDVATGAERFVVDAVELKIIQNGPYRGMFLISRHTCHKEPGCDFPTSVVRLDGSTVLTVPKSGDNEEAVSRWLRAHHWTAS